MTVDWQTGSVTYRNHEGRAKVFNFEDGGIIWYDAERGIAREGWQEQLEPFEGPGAEGFPFMDSAGR